MSMVKAAVVVKPGELTVRELPMPEPGEYGALCEMLYGATCTGTDGHLLHGKIPWPVYYPTVLGHESIGRAISVGAKVRNIKIGDMVTRVGLREEDCKKAGLNWNWGGFCTFGVAMDFKAMREDGYTDAQLGSYRFCHVLPPDFDPRAATMIITWRETLSYSARMGVCPGASVLVLGSGGVGLSYIRMAKVLGAGHVAAVGNKAREPQALRAGADAYYDYRAADWDKALGESGGFDYIIDSVAAPDGLGRAIRQLKPGGVCGIYGLETDAAKPVLVAPGATRGFTYFAGGYDEEETNGRVVELVKAGALDASIWLDMDNPFELDDICAALESAESRRAVKALIKLS